jgi:hypothetical protein
MVAVVQRMAEEYEALGTEELTVPSTIKEYIEGPWPGSKLLKKRETFII